MPKSRPNARSRIIFITGTDTGVGKTTLTALLLAHLRRCGVHALALKPFCSGSRADAKLLRAVQDNELTIEEINPFFYPEPLAPLAASRPRRTIALRRVLSHIRGVAARCDCLLVEGVGGLLVPLGRNYTVLDLILGLDCDVLVVARNRLGTLNHTGLTLRALELEPNAHRAFPFAGTRGAKRKPARYAKVVLMQPRIADPSSASNPRLLSQLLRPTPVLSLPFLGLRCHRPKRVSAGAIQLKSKLQQILI